MFLYQRVNLVTGRPYVLLNDIPPDRKPIFEKLLADGTITAQPTDYDEIRIEWADIETYINTPRPEPTFEQTNFKDYVDTESIENYYKDLQVEKEKRDKRSFVNR